MFMQVYESMRTRKKLSEYCSVQILEKDTAEKNSESPKEKGC